MIDHRADYTSIDRNFLKNLLEFIEEFFFIENPYIFEHFQSDWELILISFEI